MQEALQLYPVMPWQDLSRLEKEDTASIPGEGVFSGRVPQKMDLGCCPDCYNLHVPFRLTACLGVRHCHPTVRP
jgi:hypothetical protein